jgi:hypothetical protein
VYDANPIAITAPEIPTVANNAGFASDIAYLAMPLDDGKTCWAGVIEGGGSSANATNGSNPAQLVPGFVTRDQPFFALYESDGSIDWIKIIGKTAGDGRFLIPGTALDDPTNGRVYFIGHTLNLTGTLRFGDGEAGQVDWAVPSSTSQHVAIWCVERASGDLLWVNTIENLGTFTRPTGPMRLENGNLRLATTTSGQYRFNQINAPAGPTVNYPTSTAVVVLHDAATGAFVSQSAAYTIASGLPKAYELVGDGY